MIVFILVWIIAIIVFALDPKSPVKRWFSAALFLAGFYSFHFTILDIAYLWLSNRPLLRFLENLIIYGASMFLFPYAFLMAIIYYYTDFVEQWKKWRKPLALILLLPVIMMYTIMVFWLKNFNQPKLYIIEKS
jgi:hypothetical protein